MARPRTLQHTILATTAENLDILANRFRRDHFCTASSNIILTPAGTLIQTLMYEEA